MFDSYKPTLYLVRGVSGAGKSTFATMLSKTLRVPNYEADHYFIRYGVYTFEPGKLPEAHLWCQKQVKATLELQASCLVSNTSTTEKEVKVYQDIAKECQANFVSLIVENRNGTMSVHNVPEEVLQRQRNRFSVKL